jgi:hypothetical protein
MRRLVVLTFICLSLCGCSKENKIDQAKFEKLFRAAKAVELSVLGDPDLARYTRELQVECAASEVLASNQAEKNMVDQFRLAGSTIHFAVELKRIADSSRFGNDAKARDNWAEGIDYIHQAGEWYKAGEIVSFGSTNVEKQ